MSPAPVPIPPESVMVWLGASGSPERLVWRSRRFHVTDTPTALVGTADWWKPFEPHSYGIGHLPLDIAGWRFQATADDGETHVFDVRAAGDAAPQWQLLRIFD
ncbi:hypothetical protein [Cryobacterium psychrophilum]|uniref:Uncharacterized protein n=1 Tax=Cryobacterium psychrophilum TaxID=41988 RepID=A0A4Y8KNX1_9MICO|nr:hypothetical protein [Cryobacterium psychrophilum]TDW31383.1 hypothetical protein EDD25_3192 [Cryobacterium psychrophilum]TFD78828.1 hypothetical protein E3T53_08525 [Cryobacterium psychrophilum]